MTALPWVDCGLSHRVRALGPAPTTAEACYRCAIDTVSDEYADASLCQMCGDDLSHTNEQTRLATGYANGHDIRTEPYLRWNFGGGI